ncbi:MAG: hypothetical protein ACOYEU_05375 [Limnochordia bacterium]|jgi:hypothetical protein
MKVLRTAALVWFITLSIAAAGVAQSGFPPQVSYQLEIIELLTSEERELVLESFEFRSMVTATELALQVLAGSHVSGILGGLPFHFSARSTSEQRARLAAPAVIVTVGQTASLKVVEETLIPELSLDGPLYRTSGIEIEVTPLVIDPNANQISSAFAISSHGGDNLVHTTALLNDGEQLPLTVVTFTSNSSNRAEERYFAVFVTAEVVTDPPDTEALSIGGLGGFSELLWPEQVTFGRSNYVWVALPINPVAVPEGGFQLGQRFYLRGDFQHTSYSLASVTGGIGLLPEGLDVELQIFWYNDQAYAALGLGDSIEAMPGLVLSGGWMPAVFDLTGFKHHKSMYWFDAFYDGRPFNFRFRYLSGAEDDGGTVQSEVGYTVKENVSVFVKLSINKDRGHRISAGLRWSF